MDYPIAVVFMNDVFDGVPYLAEIRRLLLQKMKRRLGVRENCRERPVDFVRDRT